MERFKILIDVRDIMNVGQALVTAIEAISSNPAQADGYVGAQELDTGLMKLVLIKFTDQYTIREK